MLLTYVVQYSWTLKLIRLIANLAAKLEVGGLNPGRGKYLFKEYEY